MASIQQITIGLAFLLASVYLVFIALPRKRRLIWIAALIALVLAATFFVASLPYQSWRAQTLSHMMPELLFNLVVSGICLAQAGRLSRRRHGSALALVTRHPRLRAILTLSPLVLLLSWLLTLVFGMIQPMPVMESYAPAGPGFLIFRWGLVFPQIFYQALAAGVFLKSAGPEAPNLRLRAKNFAYGMGMVAWALWAIDAAVHGLMRVLLSDGIREEVVTEQLLIAQILSIVSIVALAIGLTLSYTPKIKDSLVRNAYPAVLDLQEHFESRRWHLVKGGKIRGLNRAFYYSSEAGHLLELSESDLQRTHTTIELAAILLTPRQDTGELTPEKARNLLKLREPLTENEDSSSLTTLISWPANSASSLESDSGHGETLASAPFYDALQAALSLTCDAEQESCEAPSIHQPWYYLAAIAAVDIDLISQDKGQQKATDELLRLKTFQAYEQAKTFAKSSTAN